MQCKRNWSACTRGSRYLYQTLEEGCKRGRIFLGIELRRLDIAGITLIVTSLTTIWLSDNITCRTWITQSAFAKNIVKCQMIKINIDKDRDWTELNWRLYLPSNCSVSVSKHSHPNLDSSTEYNIMFKLENWENPYKSQVIFLYYFLWIQSKSYLFSVGVI